MQKELDNFRILVYNLPDMKENKFISWEEIKKVQNENRCCVFTALNIISTSPSRFVRVDGGYLAVEK